MDGADPNRYHARPESQHGRHAPETAGRSPTSFAPVAQLGGAGSAKAVLSPGGALLAMQGKEPDPVKPGSVNGASRRQAVTHQKPQDGHQQVLRP